MAKKNKFEIHQTFGFIADGHVPIKRPSSNKRFFYSIFLFVSVMNINEYKYFYGC